MILYLATNRSDLLADGVPSCPLTACHQQGHTYPHLCFATEPLAGLGEWLHSVDLPSEAVAEYEYGNEFRFGTRARFYALPLTLLQKATLRRERFEDVVGRPWNRFVVPVLDRIPNKRERSLRGRWSVVWASREGLVDVRVQDREMDGDNVVYLSVTVTLTAEFQPERDSIVLDQFSEYDQAFVQPGQEGKPKETFELKVLAGTEPKWVLYPKLWKDWVWNQKVQDSAIDYILEQVPEVADLVRLAREATERNVVTSRWRKVSDEVGRVVSRQMGRRIDLGLLSAHSWTQVASMPLRIANRLSTNIPYGWRPPIPRPDYENPDDSGRLAVANLYGPFPTQGPGVDHAPQDRAYEGRSGELDRRRRNPFDSRQPGPANTLASI